MPEIGETLRDARMRARIDISEIEATTKIRAKYLRALENEEWSLLPGPTFVKSFLRTYAQALGLDGKALVEEYRVSHERPSEAALEPIVSSSQRSRGRPSGSGRSPGGPSRGYLAVVGVVALVIVLLIVGLISNGGGSNSNSTSKTTATTHKSTKAASKHQATTTGAAARSDIVAVSLHATAPVYVCLVAEHGRRAISGKELQAGETTSTYHSRRFEITLGNSSVTMFVDGHARAVASSSQAVGYSITKAGRKRLHSGELPTCK
jgi:cytoskeleton protein RodZ